MSHASYSGSVVTTWSVPFFLNSSLKRSSRSTLDATLIAASPSTKNEAGRRDPAMTSSKMGNQWYFGMKAHIGVDAESGLVHTAGVTTGKVHDAKVMDRLIREDDVAVYGDKGYASDARTLRMGITRRLRGTALEARRGLVMT